LLLVEGLALVRRNAFFLLQFDDRLIEDQLRLRVLDNNLRVL
jgi:hypothetical protein